ncbi:MAG: hypothetical protein KBD17_00470 [Candidatus Pacebacteria bacterium]|nr:hypothetical protein [Candidatus Paceibacterota bacterium]
MLQYLQDMKEVVNFKDIRESEQSKRKEQRDTLEILSGFLRLSEDQKRYILASLYIQQRAERATDPVSAARIEDTPDKFMNNPSDVSEPYITHTDTSLKAPHEERRRYHTSQLQVMIDFCHKVVKKLEDYREGEKIPDSWTEAGLIDSYADLEELIALTEENSTLPFVIEIWSGRPKNHSSANLEHTTVLLGKNQEGEYMVWEKSGWHMPFKVTSLKKVYTNYENSKGWRIRPLSV